MKKCEVSYQTDTMECFYYAYFHAYTYLPPPTGPSGKGKLGPPPDPGLVGGGRNPTNKHSSIKYQSLLRIDLC